MYRELKRKLFEATRRELEMYMGIYNREGDTEEAETQRQRFCALYKLVEDSNLEGEYERWVEKTRK